MEYGNHFIIFALLAIVSIFVELLFSVKRNFSNYSSDESKVTFIVYLVSYLITGLSRVLIAGIMSFVYEFRIFQIDWPIELQFLSAFLLVEFFYYWMHRYSHETKLGWASHAVHHSAKSFNLTTAYRLGWTGFFSLLWIFYVPIAWLGFSPEIIAFCLVINLFYQFWLHTELIPKLGLLEYVFNTPSHHRVHHASNDIYINKNYGGVLIIFDKLFRTFETEKEILKIRYGLTYEVNQKSVLQIAFLGWIEWFAEIKKQIHSKRRLRMQKKYNRRKFMKNTLKVGALAIGTKLSLFKSQTMAQTTAPNTKNRNILLILVDEMRFPTHFPGNPIFPDTVDNILSESTFLQKFMPNLWKLRSKSVNFTNHHTAATACTPARASLMTGLYGHQHNLLVTLLPAQDQSGNFPLIPVLSPDFPTIGRVLSALNYETMYLGKWHLSYPASNGNDISEYGPPDFQNLKHLYENGYLMKYGFKGGTYPDPEGGAPGTGERLDPQICAGFEVWNKNIRPAIKIPWFTVVSLVQPHDAQFFWDGVQDNPYKPGLYYPNYNEIVTPYAPKGYIGKFYVNPPENLEDYASRYLNKNFSIYRAAQANDMINGAISFNPNENKFRTILTNPPGTSSAPKYTTVAPYSFWAEALNYYSYLHQDLDKSIGRLIAQIEEMPSGEKPIIVFTSDHGEYAGSHGLRGKGYTGFRESTHVPLFVYDSMNPDSFLTGDRNILSSSVDILPLIASIAAGDSKTWMESQSTYQSLWSTRLDLFSHLSSNNLKGRNYILQTYDEPIVQTEQNGSPTAYHLVSYRSDTELICGYFVWDESNQKIDFSKAQYQFFAQLQGKKSLELTMTEPTQQQIQKIITAINQELRRSMTNSLNSSSRAANRQRVIYNNSLISDAIPGIVWSVVDW